MPKQHNSTTTPELGNYCAAPLLVDGYKTGHHEQYSKDLTLVFSNFTPRKSRRGLKKAVLFGLQYFLKEYLISRWNKEFFHRPKDEVCGWAKEELSLYLNKEVSDQHLRDLHDLGHIPLSFYALPEGTEYGIKIPGFVYFSTNKKFAWFTNYIETILSTTIWGPCTSATTAHQYRKLLNKYALDTVGDDSFVPWQGHDFSFRGMFGMEAALMSGAAHLISFSGTDTIPAIGFLRKYYNAKGFVGGSVPATEHSVACSIILDFVNKVRIEYRKTGNVIVEDELMQLADIEYVKHLITEVYPTGIVSIVADSFDYWNTITNTARVLKDVIMARDGKVVFRPDTGDPVKVICGYKVFDSGEKFSERGDSMLSCDYEDALDEGFELIKCEGKYYQVEELFLLGKKSLKELEISIEENEVKGSIECLWEIFGGTTTPKGYKLLDSHIGLIYGDSIVFERCHAICEGLKQKNFASINVVFGIGSFTYQYATRDTEGYAVKATYCEINDEPLNIYKDPKDDPTKKSACGLLAVFRDKNGEFFLKEQATWEDVKNCAFVHVFENSKLLKDWTLDEVRATLAQYR